MDALDRVAGAGRDLLGRVDAALIAAGAPAGSPIWPLLRRTGALPGEALEFALGLDAEPVLSAAVELRGRANEFAEQRAELVEHIGGAQQTAPAGGGAWQGAGAEAFAAQWQALSAHIGDSAARDQPSLAGRLLSMSAYLEALARWLSGLRGTLAGAVAEALTSAEAVVLRGVPPLAPGALLGPLTAGPSDGAGTGAVAQAAATVGAHVLAPVERALREGHDLHDEWAPWLAELPYRPPADLRAGGFTGITRVDL
jgi:hypothetical protein